MSAPLAVALGLSALAIFVWLLALTTLNNLTGSDAAGNGLAQAYAAIELIFLWLFVARRDAILALEGDLGIETAAGLTFRIGAPASSRWWRSACWRAEFRRPHFSGVGHSRVCLHAPHHRLLRRASAFNR